MMQSHLNVYVAVDQNSEKMVVRVSHERFRQATYEDGLRDANFSRLKTIRLRLQTFESNTIIVAFGT